MVKSNALIYHRCSKQHQYQMHHSQHTIYHQFGDLAHLSHYKPTSLHLNTPNTANGVTLHGFLSHHKTTSLHLNIYVHHQLSDLAFSALPCRSPACTDISYIIFHSNIIFRSNSELFNAESLHVGPLLQAIDS